MSDSCLQWSRNVRSHMPFPTKRCLTVNFARKFHNQNSHRNRLLSHCISIWSIITVGTTDPRDQPARRWRWLWENIIYTFAAIRRRRRTMTSTKPNVVLYCNTHNITDRVLLMPEVGRSTTHRHTHSIRAAMYDMMNTRINVITLLSTDASYLLLHRLFHRTPIAQWWHVH